MWKTDLIIGVSYLMVYGVLTKYTSNSGRLYIELNTTRNLHMFFEGLLPGMNCAV
jgi:hypothetical protein